MNIGSRVWHPTTLEAGTVEDYDPEGPLYRIRWDDPGLDDEYCFAHELVWEV